MKEKAVLRRSMRAMRDGIPQARRDAYSQKITQAILEWNRYRDARAVFVYLSMGSEADTSRLIALMHGDGKAVCIPRVHGRDMHAVPYRPGDALVRSAHGALEPPPEVPAANPDALDLILAPALAVTRSGHRLGWGGGYYDRFLAHCAAYRAALCFSAQIVDSLPVCEYDIAMDALADERGIIACGRANG